MAQAKTPSLLRANRGLIISTVLSYAFALYFGYDQRNLNPNGVLQRGANGETVRLDAFEYGFNAIALTLVFLGVAFTVAGLLVATSFAHYPFAVKARAFAKSSAIYTGLMLFGLIIGQLAQRGYL